MRIWTDEEGVVHMERDIHPWYQLGYRDASGFIVDGEVEWAWPEGHPERIKREETFRKAMTAIMRMFDDCE